MKDLRKMKTFFISLVPVYNCCILTIISCLLKTSDGVPDDYCLVPLNKSDCGKPRTPVFTYWLPGSRCEIEFWRGCPTINKFPSEFVCSHYCMGNLIEPWSNEIMPLKPKPTYPEDNLCDEIFNDDDCQKEPSEVFTYNKTTGMCHKVTWRGCESRNRFEDEVDCIQVCQAKALQEDLSKLNDQEIKNVDDLLDQVATEPDVDVATTTTTTEQTTEESSTTEDQTTTTEHGDETTAPATTQAPEAGGTVDEFITT